MKYVKDGDRVNAFNDNGDLFSYIEKQRFGTHGHWRGYQHYVFCDKLGEFIWTGIPKNVVYPEEKAMSAFESWSEEPPWFGSVKDFKNYHKIINA